jgi:mRNA interferase RelE/StbE
LGVTYRIEFRPAALKALHTLEKVDAQRIRGVVALLAADPRPPGARRLAGRPAYRVRSGDYRIIYTIEDTALVVLVVALGHRKDVYRTP